MNDKETPAEYRDKVQLIFVDQGFWADESKMDQRMRDWNAGRMEIRRYEDNYGNNMEHYCTPCTTEWKDFCRTYNGKWTMYLSSMGSLRHLKQSSTDWMKTTVQYFSLQCKQTQNLVNRPLFLLSIH